MEDNSPVKDHYKQQIIKRIVQFVGLFYLVYGVFIAYVWTSKELDVKSINNSIINYFWDPVIGIYSLGNIAVFVMILVNKYWGYHANERRTVQRPENHIIVCFMLIPLFVTTAIFNIVELIRDLSIIPCHGYLTFLVPLSTLTLITGAAILIFDVGYFAPTNTNWIKDMIKTQLIFFTVIGITNCLFITVSLQHMNIFRTESHNSSYGNRFVVNDSCLNKTAIGISLNSTFVICDKYLRPTYILFCVCTLAYLIQPLVKTHSSSSGEFEPLSTCTSVTELSLSRDHVCIDEEPVETTVVDEQNASYRLPSASLVLCITFLSLSLLSFIIMYSLRQETSVPWHKYLGSLIYCSFISIVYIIGSGLSAVHIMEIKRWPISSNRKGNIIDKCLIWIGAGGQLSLALAFVSDAVVLLKNGDGNVSYGDGHATLVGLLCMIIFSSLFLTVQTFLQTIQVSLLLDRKWIRPEINSLAESLCPAVGMMGLNMGLLLLSVDQLKSPILKTNSTIMFVDLFVREIRCVGETLGILQRLHAALLFASMILYTHN